MANKRGFACLSPEKRREIASKGGKAAQSKPNAHRWTVEEAREAGKKGGRAVFDKYGTIHMQELGREGGYQPKSMKES